MRTVHFIEPGGYSTPKVQPSLRETEVLQMLLRGQLVKEMAYELGVTEDTVHNHLLNVSRHLIQPDGSRLVSRSEIARWVYTYEKVLKGEAASPILHIAGCTCGSAYCSTQLIRDKRVSPAAA